MFLGLGLALIATAVGPCSFGSLLAQQADVVRGRITGTDGEPVVNASIQLTSIPNNVKKSTTTGRDGRYTVAFPNGDGDYWVTVSAIGFVPRRFELKRIADEDILVADAVLKRAAAVLDAMHVRADRAKVARNNNSADISGTEKTVGTAAVDPNQAGNLAAMAAALPGVQLVPGADGNPDQFSVFGLSGDQNTATLNGLGFSGADIPRDAATKSALGTTPWDVSRGGFSGGQLGLRTQSGSNFSARGVSSVAAAPQLEWTDRAGRAAGAEYGSVSLGAMTAGPIVVDNSFYSAGYQLDRRTSDLQSLTTASPLALLTAGVAMDSAARFRNLLSRGRIPISAAGLPTGRVNEHGSFLAAVDFSPPSSTSGQALNLTATGTFNRLNTPFGQVTALPTADAQRTNWFGALQARHTNYFGFGVLTETSVGVGRSRVYTDPYLALPSGVVRVGSTLGDGSTSIAQLGFGGSAVQNTRSTNTTASAVNQLSWFSQNNKHRIKLTSEVREESYAQDLTMNQLGTFAYNSLADLEAGKPSSFSRQLSPRPQSGSQAIGGLSLGDSYRPSTDLQFQYGVRVDANHYWAAPATNDAVRQTFGVTNDVVPNRVYLSPRAGFSWTYGQAARLAVADGFVRGPRAVVRGGIGLFQNTPNAQLIASATSSTGLADALQQLTCVGTAVPAPDWNAYATDANAIPNKCADGTLGTVFSSSAPNVVLFDKSYAAQRSVRSDINWSGAVLGNRLTATIDGTYSLNLNQPGFVDLNVNPAIRFTLPNESGRPVFVQTDGIVGATGAIAVQDARLSPSFARVIEQRSDLQSISRQLFIGMRPISFSTRYSWELGYVYSNTRDVASGFMSTTGNPFEKEWARSAFDSRHQVVYSLAYNFFDWVPVSLSGSFRSGRPFTPLVSDDINGDGYSNDRAFIFDPKKTSDPTLAAGLSQLLDNGSPAARACLASQLGRLAIRNSCQAPWTTTSNLTVAFNPLKFRLPQRFNFSLYVNNAFGAADLLLHGDARRKGWGQPASPDQSLLFVRGFDVPTRTFKYEVNSRFGATSLGQTTNRNPVVVTAQIRMDLGFTRERQLLTQSLDRGRGRPGTKSTDQDLKDLSAALIPTNPMALLLSQADTLKLTRKQADSLSSMNRRYLVLSDSLWTPVVTFLAGLSDSYNRGEAYDRFRRAREVSIDQLLRLAPSIRGLLNAQQLRLLPAQIISSLDTRYLASVRSSTAGGTNMGILGMLAQMGAMGGASDASGAQTIMIHK
ncbi:MAG: carboxypeptidase-like regulatory domain-containing protein [bacterium]